MNPLDPKGAAGLKKPQLQLIPPVLNNETAKALLHGNLKYGPWNWRGTQVEMMTYLGAMKRHIDAVLSGEDIDPESGAHHLGHVAASCGIVLDAKMFGTLVDNRPPQPPQNNAHRHHPLVQPGSVSRNGFDLAHDMGIDLPCGLPK